MLSLTRSLLIVLASMFLFFSFSAQSQLAESQAIYSPQELDWIKSNPIVTFAGDPDFAPIEFYDEQGKYVGIVPDTLSYISQQTGLTFNVTKTDTWQDSVELLRQKKVDMLPLISSFGRSDQSLLFTSSYLDYPSVILVRNDTKNVSQLDDLKGKRVVVVSEWSAEKEIKQNYPEIELLVAPNSREAIDRLLFGHADAMIHYFPVASYELLQRGIGSVRIAGRTSMKDGAMAVSDNLPLLHSILNKTLNNIDPTTKQNIQSKWLHTNEPNQNSGLDLTPQEQTWLSQHPVLKVAHDQDWKPFSYVLQGESQGFSIDYMKLVANKLNIELEMVSGPWNEVYQQAIDGEVDLILDLIRTPEREQHHFLYTPPYARNPNAIVTKQSDDYSTLKSLEGKTVSFVQGSFLHEVLSEYDINLSPRADSVKAFKALQFGEVDAVLSRIVIARQVINDNALYDLEIKSELDTGNQDLDNMNIGVPKDRALLHSILVKAMKHLDMGQVNELRKRALAQGMTESVGLNQQEKAAVTQASRLKVRIQDDIDQFVSLDNRFDIDRFVLDALGKKIGVGFEYQHEAAANGDFESFTHDKLDIKIGTRETFASQAAHVIKKPILSSYYAVAMQNSVTPITSLSELPPDQMIGVVGSNQYIEELNLMYPDLFFGKVLGEEAGLRDLQRGELDGLIADGMSIEYFIRKNQWVDLDIAFVTSKKIQYLMAFNQHVDKGVISALNKAQKSLTPSDYAVIFDSHQTAAMVPSESRSQQQVLSPDVVTSELVIKASVGGVALLLALIALPVLLNRYLSDQTIRNLYTNKMMTAASVVVVFILMVVSVAAYMVIGKVEQQTRHNIQLSLSGITEALNTSVDIWIDGRTAYINSVANEPALLPMVEELLEVEANKESLKFSTVLIDLRVHFASLQAAHGDRGFFIISKDRVNVASMRDSNLGDLNIIQQQRPDLLDKVFLGETTLITPISSDLGNNAAADKGNINATMFIAAPIVNEVGEVIAAMTFRYDPAHEFSQIFASGRIGLSGESYAFDEQGYFLSDSRFERELKSSGMLNPQANTILNLQMVKPSPLSKGNDSQEVKDQDYTKAYLGALRDIKGGSGDGYLDYRGVPVLGSWIWRENEQFGFVTEIDEQEALKGYISTRNLIVSLLLFTVFLTIGLTALTLWLGRRTQAILLESNERLEQNVRERTLRLTSIIDNATGTAIYLKGMDGRYQMVNKHFEAVTGLDSSKILEQRDSELFDQQRADRIKQIDKQVLATGQAHEYEDSLIDANGVEHYFLTKKIPLVEEDGTMIGMFGFSTDVTELKSIQQDLEIAKNTAEEATKSKSDFLANMSHEIRTPMNAIIGMSYLALQTDLTRKQSDYLNKILNASNSLLGVINDILDFSKIEAGKLDLEVIPFALEGVMDNLSNIVTVKSREKNLELLISIDPTIPPMLFGDPLRIGQILLNLANNAVKFTDQGEVLVKVELTSMSHGRAQLRFSVQDSGIGMSEQQMSRLFQAFSQADSSTTRKYGGTGLGLTISQNLVELMNGSIGCESELEAGSTFFFDLELEVDTTSAVKAPRLSTDYVGMRVLIVDDSAESRDILNNMSQAMGLLVDEVDSGMQALVQLAKADSLNEPYDLILLDYKMPHMNGFDTLDSIRKLTLSVTPKVVMVTAYGEDEVRSQAQQYHLDGFLVKPVSSSSLFDTLSDAFDDNKVGAVESFMPSQLSDMTIDEGVRGAHILLVEDNEVNQQVALELLELAQFKVTVANNGAEAVTAVEHEAFDAVLMDIQMPVMDGYQATGKIRTDLEKVSLPIIAMTANAMASDKERCLAAGMDDHVAKPIDPAVLFGVLNRWIEHKERELPQAKKQQEELPLPQLMGFDVPAAVARMGGRVSSYNKALSMVNDTLLDNVRNITESVANREEQTAVLATHTLKGVSGNIGHKALFEATQALEDSLRSASSDNSSLVEAVEKHALEAFEVLSDYLATMSSSPANSPMKEFDPVQVKTLLDQLSTEIEEFDINAGETCQSLMDYLHEPQWQTLVTQLEQSIANYDFDEAQQQVEDIIEKLR